ncbi:hypothetical protein [Hutsoniella sourekii]|uniref:hypothetical protein n=1 Tax=Hutsoniella sourekii TaxID=87650 RepID=UPI0004B677D1|nr:hypothetical protein [Hutsoniella sourekii]
MKPLLATVARSVFLIGGNIIKDTSIYKTDLFLTTINNKLEREKCLRQVNESQWFWQDNHPMITEEVWIEDGGEFNISSNTEPQSFLFRKVETSRAKGLLIHESILDLYSHLSLDVKDKYHNHLIALHENIDLEYLSQFVHHLLGEELTIKELIFATPQKQTEAIIDNFPTFKRNENIFIVNKQDIRVSQIRPLGNNWWADWLSVRRYKRLIEREQELKKRLRVGNSNET